MKIKDMFEPGFWEKYGDVDVSNDTFDDMAPAFCGGLRLTDASREDFKDALDVEIVVVEQFRVGEYPYRYIECLLENRVPDDKQDDVWDKIKMLFEYAAGYCTEDEYSRYFEEVEDAG